MLTYLKTAGGVLLFVVVLFSSVLWHELVGHALSAILVGGGIDRLVLFGLEVWPSFQTVGMSGGFAVIDIVGVEEGTLARGFVRLAGSASTFLAAVAAVVVLFLCRLQGWKRVSLLAVAWWFLDLLTFTLPSIGLRRGLFFGTRWSEPYEGAVTMGVPGPAFQAIVFAGSTAVLLALWMVRRSSAARGNGAMGAGGSPQSRSRGPEP